MGSKLNGHGSWMEIMTVIKNVVENTLDRF